MLGHIGYIVRAPYSETRTDGNLRNGSDVVEVVGNFRRGDVVTLVDSRGNELGRGLAEYSSEEAERLAGCHSEQIEERLGYRGRSVMVHRDELVLFDHD